MCIVFLISTKYNLISFYTFSILILLFYPRDFQMQISNHSHNSNMQSRDGNETAAPSPTQETECLPEENVSIIEDMTTEDKLENMKAIVSGTMRRKLYFNPAYFEPHLLMVSES